MGVQELFTELKNIHRRPSNDVTNMAPFRVFLVIYRGKWPKNGLKINWGKKISALGGPKTPILVLESDFMIPYGLSRPDFENFIFPKKFDHFSLKFGRFLGI